MWTSVPTNVEVREPLEDARLDHPPQDHGEAAGLDIEAESFWPAAADRHTLGGDLRPEVTAGKKNWVCTLIGMPSSTAAAQNRSSSGDGSENDPLG